MKVEHFLLQMLITITSLRAASPVRDNIQNCCSSNSFEDATVFIALVLFTLNPEPLNHRLRQVQKQLNHSSTRALFCLFASKNYSIKYEIFLHCCAITISIENLCQTLVDYLTIASQSIESTNKNNATSVMRSII